MKNKKILEPKKAQSYSNKNHTINIEIQPLHDLGDLVSTYLSNEYLSCYLSQQKNAFKEGNYHAVNFVKCDNCSIFTGKICLNYSWS